MKKKNLKKTAVPKPVVGNLIRTVFLDHCLDSGDASLGVEFEVVGRVTALTSKVMVVRVWGEPNHFGHDHNSNSFSIVRSCISKLEILRKK